jgi:hypothetical protein
MKISSGSALGAFFVLTAIAVGCSPASAQTSFPTPGGGRVDGKVVMCLNGNNQAVPRLRDRAARQGNGLVAPEKPLSSVFPAAVRGVP